MIEHLVRHLEALGRGDRHLAAAIALAGQAELVVTVTEPSHNPYYTLVEMGPDGSLHLSKPADFARRQDAPTVWGLNGSIYVWSRSGPAHAAQAGFWAVSMLASPMPRECSVDIDDALDFELAEWFLRRQQAQMADSRP